jgi:hypothetical protein
VIDDEAMPFIELTIDKQRIPGAQTDPVLVGTRHVLRIERRPTIDKDGGASVTLVDGKVLNVAESYARVRDMLTRGGPRPRRA